MRWFWFAIVGLSLVLASLTWFLFLDDDNTGGLSLAVVALLIYCLGASGLRAESEASNRRSGGSTQLSTRQQPSELDLPLRISPPPQDDPSPAELPRPPGLPPPESDGD